MSRTKRLFLERTHSQTIAVLLGVSPRVYRLLDVFHPNDPVGIRSFFASHGEPLDKAELQNVTRRIL